MNTGPDIDYPFHQYIPVSTGIIADHIDSRQSAVGKNGVSGFFGLEK
jgi:hypothetical protein